MVHVLEGVLNLGGDLYIYWIGKNQHNEKKGMG